MELQDANWLQDLAFMLDVTEQWNNLNKMTQGLNKVRQYHDSIRAFHLKLALMKTQLSKCEAHFPHLKGLCASRV